MAKSATNVGRRAKHGEKMIWLLVGFHTENIADESGEILPKHAWTSGFVRTNGNKSHGITPTRKPVPFNSLLQLSSAIEKLLIEHGITLCPTERMKKFLVGS